jgi:hypothetical protein
MNGLEQDCVDARGPNGLQELFNFSLATEAGFGPGDRGNHQKGAIARVTATPNCRH